MSLMNAKTSNFFAIFSLMVTGLLIFLPAFSIASTTSGTVDTTNRYAWSENVGWIDFGTTLGAVTVTDSALSGYAFSENTGWINLSTIANDSAGTLSGSAWSENAGWIDFKPTNGGVEISSSGVFSGYAYGENIGWINFSTDNPVTTDWRPASTQTSSASTPAPVRGNGAPGALGGNGGIPFTLTPPRLQTIYPDGHIVYHDEVPTASTGSASTSSRSNLSSDQGSIFGFSRNLSVRNKGEDVRNLQKFLNQNGFTVSKTGAGSEGNETTTFGSATFKALVKFQKANHITPASGFLGPKTRAFIKSLSN